VSPYSPKDGKYPVSVVLITFDNGQIPKTSDPE
jgi:hypothetical protein